MVTEREIKQIRGACYDGGSTGGNSAHSRSSASDRSDPEATGALGPQFFSRTRTQSAAPLLFASGVMKMWEPEFARVPTVW